MRTHPLRRIAVTAAVLLLAAGVSQMQTARDRTVAVVGATLIDGTGKPPVPDSAIVIMDGKITAVGPKSSTTVPADAQVISVTGKYVIPGLIDGHVHYRTWAGELYLNHGVTTVLDVGNISEWMVALKKGFAQGKVKRIPRIYSSGYALNGSEAGFDPFGSAVALVKRPGTYHYTLIDPEVARKMVGATMIEEQDLDFIKTFQKLTPEVFRAIADEAHKRGKRVMGHTDNAYDSVRNGMDAIVHLWGVAETTMSPQDQKAFLKGDIISPYARMQPAAVDKLIAFLVERKIYVNPLLVHEHEPVTDRVQQFKAETYVALGSPNLAYIPVDARLAMLSVHDRARNYSARLGAFPFVDALRPEELNEFRIGYRNAQAFVKKFVAGGGKVWVGSDAGGGSVVPGLTVHQDMQLLVDAGLTPMQVIVAATSIPAELIGKEKEVGSIAPGRFADLVVLEADPLTDIANTRKISLVMQGGDVVDRGYHWNYSLPFANPVETDNVTNAYLPKPRLEEIAPKLVSQGASAVKVTVNGLGFSTRSTVMFNDIPLKTTFESVTLLTAEVPSTLLRNPGTWPVTVSNPAPGGGVSNVLGFIVQFGNNRTSSE